jgi:hypothetical protein
MYKPNEDAPDLCGEAFCTFSWYSSVVQSGVPRHEDQRFSMYRAFVGLNSGVSKMSQLLEHIGNGVDADDVDQQATRIIGDTLFHLCWLAATLGVTLEDAAVGNAGRVKELLES